MIKNVRLVELDVFRGWAVILMLIFHLCYDLNYFGYIHIDIYQGNFWIYFRNTIVAIFLVSMGISLSLAHTPYIKWHKIKQRILILLGASLLVSVATYFVFPSAWVYFGILHFILFATVLGLFFLPYPRLSFIVSILIYITYTLEYIHMHWLWDFVDENIIKLPLHPVDSVGLMSWFPFVLIGMPMMSYGYHKTLLQNSYFKPSFKHNQALALLGRHSLLIYLIHQPILFGFLMLLDA